MVSVDTGVLLIDVLLSNSMILSTVQRLNYWIFRSGLFTTILFINVVTYKSIANLNPLSKD